MSQFDISVDHSSLEINRELAEQVYELINRLQNNIYSERPKNRSRREDGVVSIYENEEDNELKIQIRLNSYDFKRSGVVNMKIDEQVFATSIMIRDQLMGGDSRELIAVPQRIKDCDLVIIENLIYGACKCIGSGSILPKDNDNYGLFLPSMNPLPTFNKDFEICGLPSAY